MARIPPIDIDSQNVPSGVGNFAIQVKKAFQDLLRILINLSPLENFTGFPYEGTLAAGAEAKITNKLKIVPSGYIIYFCQGGIVQAGDTVWTKDFVYIKNVSAISSATFRIFFFV